MGLGRAGLLVAETNFHFKRTLEGGYESDRPWRSVSWLQGHGNQLVFKRALSWLDSDNPLRRDRAAAVLGRLRTSGWRPDRGPRYESFRLNRQESFDAIVAALQKESDAHTIASLVSALGHLDIEEAVPVVARFAEHGDKEVRFSVSWTLGCYQMIGCQCKCSSSLWTTPTVMFAIGPSSVLAYGRCRFKSTSRFVRQAS